ncbi:MAG: hypothetical protein Q9227_007562 [Pyrenula ochraceoflavens]
MPGDVYEVSDPSLTQLPCDSLLLAGDCIINESMLTGESVPVSKVPVLDEALHLLDLSAPSIHPSVAKHFLFCGTKIIRARRPQDVDDDEAVALAMAVRIGFSTTKGALVRSMLFPKPSGFKFYRDSFRYISVMACIAMVGFVASFVNFIRLGLAWHLIIVRALDLITIVVPPALPATLTIGVNFALSRLKQKQIFCISPQRVNVGGKLDVVCFDKTGTLTEDGLDILGVRAVRLPEMSFSGLLSEVPNLLPGASYERDPTIDYQKNKNILYTMATCHSLRLVDGELIGDPLDLKMFQFTGWTYDEGIQKTSHFEEIAGSGLSLSVAKPPMGMEFDIDDARDGDRQLPTELGVLRSFEFVSQLRRASVIVRQYGEDGASVFVKGAPEAMKDICKSSSLPHDYEELLSYYTHRGFRVIACASKYIFNAPAEKISRMERASAESGLEFDGFIIFENKLKEITSDVIEELNEAAVRVVMCTGDNILTAISVARECNLIDQAAHCFVPHFLEGQDFHVASIVANFEKETIKILMLALAGKVLTTRSISLTSILSQWVSFLLRITPANLGPQPVPISVQADTSGPYDALSLRNYCLAVSGDVFRWVIDYGSQEVLEKVWLGD